MVVGARWQRVKRISLIVPRSRVKSPSSDTHERPPRGIGSRTRPRCLSRVLNSPALVFLSGGPLEQREGADPSFRAIFYRRLKTEHPDIFKRVLLAEEAHQWSKVDRPYWHLLELEGELASLSAVILLLVASTGSFAE